MLIVVVDHLCLNPLKSGHCFNLYLFIKNRRWNYVSIPLNRVIVSIDDKIKELEDALVERLNPLKSGHCFNLILESEAVTH